MSTDYHQIRNLKDGPWYWVDKAVIQRYMPQIGIVGITVYSFLASMVDIRQSCFPSQQYIARALGISRATVNKAIKTLEMNHLIEIEKVDKYRNVYHLLEVRCQAEEVNMSNRETLPVKQENTNDNKVINNNNDIDIVSSNNLFSNMTKRLQPQTREELLAMDIADALDDHKAFALYHCYAKKYPESLLRRVLGEVKEIPDEKIIKGRGALFNYLVQQYVKRASESSGD